MSYVCSQVLTVFVVFFFQGSAAQIVGSMLITACYVVVLHEYKPYIRASDNSLALLLQYQLLFVHLALLLYKVDLGKEPKPEEAEEELGLVKAALVGFLPAYQAVVLLVEALGSWRQLNDRRQNDRASKIVDEAADALSM